MGFLRQYPRLLTFLVACAAAYVLFRSGYIHLLDGAIIHAPYVSAFLSGILFSFGFSAPFATALFLDIAPSVDPLTAAVAGGIGAFLSDALIFQTLRSSFFADEVERIRETVIIRHLHALFHRVTPMEKLRTAILWIVAGFLIASPFPDEIGVTLVSGLTRMHVRTFAILSLLLNTLGIAVILLLGRM